MPDSTQRSEPGPSGGARQRVVVATADVLGQRMAGPAIRAWNIAGALSAEHDVELVTVAGCTRESDRRFAVRGVDAGGISELATRTDIWITQGNLLDSFGAIAASDAIVVADLYDPYHLENLESSRGHTLAERGAMVHNATAKLNQLLVRGDFFLAASSRQRDFWLGALASLGRINPRSYDDDLALTSLVGVVPFGISPQPPQRQRPALRGVIDGIGPDDVVLLWGGGLYNWFDPQTLIEAVDRIRHEHDTVRLVFLGVKHPSPGNPSLRTATEARALAERLDLVGKYVFFVEEWIPYDERGSFLLEADIGVSTHLDHVETAFSFRTRILDYLWAGLPIVSTEGDVFAELIAARGLGAAVPPRDVEALATALSELIADPARRAVCAEASRSVGRGYVWETALAPLVEFCRCPKRASDLLDGQIRGYLARPFDTVRAPTPGPGGWRGEVALAREYVRAGGVGLLLRRGFNRLGKMLRGRRD
ncbi:glycosyltransferase family 4 protein [Jatrophihabitans sp. GAS493]|uniref:glycosyltransferase family 4 protein n=1 Tax=Jatrophihabitans sp. GAS493 TaxID=1907575 RepID=UPI0012FE1BBE|nr:glycosyltransferase family 4 protein [Jatrophihabitans sp. GAS493]